MSNPPVYGTEPIPERPALPLIGHALDIPSGADGLMHVMKEAKELGPVFKLRVFGNEMNFVSGLDLVTELSDETRFVKNVHADLVLLRGIGGDGLFTAFNDEPNWHKAHHILMPAFSLGAMRGYHATMLEVARTLIGTWDRAAGQRPVDVAADMTRLTFDTIGLCGFGYDFESFAREDPHPFVTALSRALDYAQKRGESIPGTELFQRKKTERFHDDVQVMKDLVAGLIRRRRAAGDESTDDLLGRMLHTPDPVTGELLDDEHIAYQAITFIIAGHETTSGALSFALYYLTKHPEVLARAQAEVDALWGDAESPEPQYGDIGKLAYIRQVLNESLRLWPTAPGYAVEPVEDTVISGKYAVRKGESLQVLIPALHRDPAWGDNVELFDPDRFSPEQEESRPVHLFKPFGNGERACIGRQFALHEATLVLAIVVHRYRLLDHTNYQLKIKSALTIKPDEFTLNLARRSGNERRLPTTVAVDSSPADQARPSARRGTGTALTVLHGSNLGTCAGIARDLAADGDEHGFTTAVASLDESVDELSSAGGPVVIVAASYNGRPTDDAADFVPWLEELEPGSLDGVRYAVLGVGDRNWAATYQRIPTLIDERLTAAGATPCWSAVRRTPPATSPAPSTDGPATCGAPCSRSTAPKRPAAPRRPTSRTPTRGCTSSTTRRSRSPAHSPTGTAYSRWRCWTRTNWSTWTTRSAAPSVSSNCGCPQASPTAPATTSPSSRATLTPSRGGWPTGSASTWTAPSGCARAAAAGAPCPSTVR